ncbi:MAG: tetratricopeptide repeat protein [Candidatus Wallbacteria bacterium]|nr:tetratricopeptide repeat protein [Candidatus Wallbacteria bacterium]
MGSILWEFFLDFMTRGLWYLAGIILLLGVFFIFVKKVAKPMLASGTPAVRRKGMLEFTVVSLVFLWLFIQCLYPLISYFFFYYGLECLNDGQIVNAYQEFREAGSYFPGNKAFQEKLGIVAFISGKHVEACEILAASDTHNPEANVYYGAALLECGKIDQAIQILNSTLRSVYNPTMAFVYLGRSYSRKNDLPKALMSFQSALQTADKYQNLVKWELVQYYEKTGDLKYALSLCREILDKPDFDRWTFREALAFYRNNGGTIEIKAGN